jgi:hypothetical protein
MPRGGKRSGSGKPKGHLAEKTKRKRAARERELHALEVNEAAIIGELVRIAFADNRDFFDVTGCLKPLSQWTAEMGARVASFEIIKKNAEAGDGIIDTVHKLKSWDKLKALEMLAKHRGLLTEKVEHKGEIRIKWQD